MLSSLPELLISVGRQMLVSMQKMLLEEGGSLGQMLVLSIFNLSLAQKLLANNGK